MSIQSYIRLPKMWKSRLLLTLWLTLVPIHALEHEVIGLTELMKNFLPLSNTELVLISDFNSQNKVCKLFFCKHRIIVRCKCKIFVWGKNLKISGWISHFSSPRSNTVSILQSTKLERDPDQKTIWSLPIFHWPSQAQYWL